MRSSEASGLEYILYTCSTQRAVAGPTPPAQQGTSIHFSIGLRLGEVEGLSCSGMPSASLAPTSIPLVS